MTKTNNDDCIEIEWPWNMVPDELFDELSDDIKTRIPADHIFQGKDIYPSIRHEEKRIWIWENATDGNLIVFDFSKKRIKGMYWYRIETDLELVLKKYK